MTKYKVLVTRRAERDINDLEPTTRNRIKGALIALSDGYEKAKRLHNTELGQYRMRVGDWRIVFDVEGKEIVILRIGHRREIYRRV
jgi:mRNA interferase RelE/StbE